jgi:hypothetical protein
MARAKKNTDPKEEAARKEASDIRKWLDKIEHSEKYRKKTADRYRWSQLVDEYRGYFVGLTDSTDIYVPSLNLIFAYVKSEIPSLYLRDPKIKVNPKKGTSVLSAKILEKALNYIWRTKRLKRENKKNVLDSLLVGHSWFKCGYAGSFGTVEDANGNTYEFVEKDDFFGYRVPYENITFNPDANDPPYDCTWIAQEVWVPLEELKANTAFKNTEKLSGDSVPTNEKEHDGIDGDIRNRSDKSVPRVKLYEVWDKKTNSVFTITPGCEKYLQAPRKMPYTGMKGLPFSFLRLNDDPMCPYGIPDCFMFEPQVIELMKIRASAIDHIKRYNRQLLLAQGHMSPDTIDQFKQGVTGAILEVRTDGKPLADIVGPIPYPNLQTDMYAVEDRIKEDMINVSGQSANDRGAQQKTTTRTVKELVQIQKGGQNRRSDKIDTIEDFVEDIASNFVALIQQLADSHFYVSVTGEDQEELMQALQSRPSAKDPGAVADKNGFTFNKKDVQGEFDYEIVPGSTTPMDQEQKLNMLTQMYEMAQKSGMIPGGPVQEYFANEFADELDLPGLKAALDKEKELAQQQAQQKQQQADQQQQMLVAQNAAEVQLKAEREATRQQELVLRGIDTFHNHSQDRLPPIEDNRVSKSIAFKDLPPDGKVQLAAEAGLQIKTPPPDPKPTASKPNGK